jgi:streptogramin lyase
MRLAVRLLAAVSVGVLLLVSAAGAAGTPPISYYSVARLPTSIAAGHDGNLWFIDDNGNGFGNVTPAGVVSTWNWDNTGTNRGLKQIAAGPDGNVWVTMCIAQRIAKITPAGAVTEYAAGITSCPDGITAGPDGNMWFTETYGAIGKITMGGQVTEYDGPYHAGLLSAASHPIGIVAGPDGNMWFTEWGNDRIGKITTSGTLTQYAVTSGSGPTGIVAGPDGNLWFTEDNGNRIGKITTAGAVTEYSSGIPSGSYPEGITAGPDGNLWFTEYSSGGKIGRITPSGTVTEYGAGSASPYGIAAGADGNIWFTEYNGARIGRLDLHATAPTPTPTPPHSWYVKSVAVIATVKGNGRITGGGVNCPGKCRTTLTTTVRHVKLTATAAPGYRFAGWSGNCPGKLWGLTPCTLMVLVDGSYISDWFATLGGFQGGYVKPSQPNPMRAIALFVKSHA